jgi:hypothetical protein
MDLEIVLACCVPIAIGLIVLILAIRDKKNIK